MAQGQTLRRIGDTIVFDEFSEDVPLAVGLIIKEGSTYRRGMETLEFKGLSAVDGKPCALLGVDGGESSFTMVMEVRPNVNMKTVGGTRYFGDIDVDRASMWLRKAEITVVDGTETSMGGKVVANTTLESHYRIRANGRGRARTHGASLSPKRFGHIDRGAVPANVRPRRAGGR